MITAANIPDACPQRWRGEVRNWFEFLPIEYHDRLQAAIESSCCIGIERGEGERQIARRMVETLRAIDRSIEYDDDSQRNCIRDFLAAGEAMSRDPADRAERPLPMPSGFKDWKAYGAHLKQTAAPLVARMSNASDRREFEIARIEALEVWNRTIRKACKGMTPRERDSFAEACGSPEDWADKTPPTTGPGSPTLSLASSKPAHASTSAARSAKAPASNSAGRIAYRRASDIQAKPINWLWPGRIARGKVSMLAGNPGLGKSQITSSMAAVVTTAGIWPVDKCRCERGNVIFLSAEDDPEDTIRPRLEAAGADLSRVFILDAVVDGFRADGNEIKRAFNLKTDLARLGAMLDEIGGAALIVIDPITAYLGEADSHKNAEIRALLSPLSDLAAKHGAAVVCVSHLNKSSGGEALMRVTGSLAFVAAARAAFVVAKDNDDPERRLLLPLKNNIGNDQTGLSFTVESTQVQSSAGTVETSRIVWGTEAVTVTADEAVASASNPEEHSDMQDAKTFLRDLLSDGPVPSKQIRADAEDAGYSWRTIQRAQKVLGIDAVKDGMRGGWVWKLS